MMLHSDSPRDGAKNWPDSGFKAWRKRRSERRHSQSLRTEVTCPNEQRRHLRIPAEGFWVIITHRNAGNVRLRLAERDRSSLKFPLLSDGRATAASAKTPTLAFYTAQSNELYQEGNSHRPVRVFFSWRIIDLDNSDGTSSLLSPPLTEVCGLLWGTRRIYLTTRRLSFAHSLLCLVSLLFVSGQRCIWTHSLTSRTPWPHGASPVSGAHVLLV